LLPDILDGRLPKTPTPQPSLAVRRERATLRTMLGLSLQPHGGEPLAVTNPPSQKAKPPFNPDEVGERL